MVSYACWDIFHNTWTVVVSSTLGIIGITVLIYRLRRKGFGFRFYHQAKGKLREYLSNRFNTMSAYDFENFVANLFEKQGYRTDITPSSRDSGVDIILRKSGESIAVQVKRWSEDNHVGSREIQYLLGGRQIYNCNRALFITTSSFTQDAKEAAQKTGVELWDWNRLYMEIRKVMGQLAQ